MWLDSKTAQAEMQDRSLSYEQIDLNLNKWIAHAVIIAIEKLSRYM